MLPKTAIVTTAAPPSASGQARVLAQLLDTPMGACPIFLTDRMIEIEADAPRIGRYVGLQPPRFQLIGRAMPRGLATLNNMGGLVATVLARAKQIRAALAHENVGVIVGCSGNPFDLPAAFLAARWMRIPFVAYLFDDPVFQWEPGPYRRFARFWEQVWGKGCAVIITPNEVLEAEVRQRLPQGQFTLVRNPVGPAAFAADGTADRAVGEGASRSLLYTGSVYWAQGSAFRNLVAALDELSGRFTLDVYTAQSPADLQANGVGGVHVRHHPHVPQAATLGLQQQADVLFLPLAFESPIPEVVQSSAPAKLGEYLASGRPILAHAPRGSFVSEILKKHEAALVVDEPEPKLLVAALDRLGRDAQLTARLAANARLLAAAFHVDKARDAYATALAMAVSKKGPIA